MFFKKKFFYYKNKNIFIKIFLNIMKNKLENKIKFLNKKSSEIYFLILHNDKYNTFKYVSNSLMEICSHSEVQAEQCTFITHHIGECDVKKGAKKNLEMMSKKLKIRGLTVSIRK